MPKFIASEFPFKNSPFSRVMSLVLWTTVKFQSREQLQINQGSNSGNILYYCLQYPSSLVTTAFVVSKGKPYLSYVNLPSLITLMFCCGLLKKCEGLYRCCISEMGLFIACVLNLINCDGPHFRRATDQSKKKSNVWACVDTQRIL